MEFDLIIKNWNAPEYLDITLSSVVNNTKDKFNIVIVDNGSELPIDKIVSKYNKFIDIKIIKLHKNVGTAEAINVGLRKAKSDIVVISDNDVFFDKGWGKILSHFRDKNIIAVAPKRISRFQKYPWSENTTRQEWESLREKCSDPLICLEKFSQGHSLAELNELINEKNCILNDECINFPNFASFSTMAIRREYINDKFPLADSEFGMYGGEDVDFCWRSQKAGYKIIRCNEVYIHHFEHSSLIKNKVDYSSLMERGNMVLYNKWKDEIYKCNVDTPFLKIFKEIEKSGKIHTF